MSMSSVFAILFAIIGLIFGVLMAVFLQNKHLKLSGYAEKLASGFMLAVVFFDLLPTAGEKANFLIVLIGLMLGIVLILLTEKITAKEWCTKFQKCDIINGKNSQQVAEQKAVRLSAKISTAIAIALHNIPEGIVLGALDGESMLISTAILIALHNIPEGVAMAIPPLKIGTKWYIVLLFGLAVGACTAIGYLIGLAAGGVSDALIAMLLALSGGAMLQIVFGDMFGADGEACGGGGLVLVGLLIGFVIASIV